jgi:hypothetical protein
VYFVAVFAFIGRHFRVFCSHRKIEFDGDDEERIS